MGFDEQKGFDFGDVLPAQREQAAGTWSDPEFSTLEYRALFEKADAAIMGLVGVWRTLFSAGIGLGKLQLVDQSERCESDRDKYTLWAVKIEVSAEDVERFMNQCPVPSPYECLEFKSQRRQLVDVSAAYLKGCGTIIARRWAPDNFSVTFVPWRCTVFLDSYADDIVSIELPYSTWGNTYSCQKLSESGAGVASLKSFSYGGRQYINSGKSYRHGLSQGTCWRLCALGDWRGTTYSYRELIAAYDSGTKERGDMRGVLVLVAGKKCVLESAATFFDRAPIAIESFTEGEGELDDEED